MNELSQKIDEIVPEGRRNRHSFFQLQYFVIGKEPTVQARIQACKNELIVRKDEIESLMVMLEGLYDQFRIEELKIEEIKKSRRPDQIQEIDQIQIREFRRKIKGFEYQIEDFKGKLQGKEEEANFLLGLYDKLCEIEEPKDWDSLPVQAEYWNARLTRDIESHLMLGKTPDAEVVQTVLALPDGMPIKAITHQLMKRGQKVAQEENSPDEVNTPKEIEDGGQT